MTVAQLIEQLEKMPKEAIITISGDGKNDIKVAGTSWGRVIIFENYDDWYDESEDEE